MLSDICLGGFTSLNGASKHASVVRLAHDGDVVDGAAAEFVFEHSLDSLLFLVLELLQLELIHGFILRNKLIYEVIGN